MRDNVVIISFHSHFLLNDGVWTGSLHIDDGNNERELSSVSCPSVKIEENSFLLFSSLVVINQVIDLH